MEEQVLKILIDKIQAVELKNSAYKPTAIDGIPQSAKEITAHVFEFIEWTGENYIKANKLWLPRYSDCRIQENWKTTDKLYQYWLENIKK